VNGKGAISLGQRFVEGPASLVPLRFQENKALSFSAKSTNLRSPPPSPLSATVIWQCAERRFWVAQRFQRCEKVFLFWQGFRP
jgi:hypothetical protein